MSEWVSFREYRPDQSGWYICAYEYKITGTKVEPMWWWDAQGVFDDGSAYPTHWMPLPEPPK